MKKITFFLFILLQTVFPGSTPSLYFTPNKETDKMILSIIDNAKNSVYIAGYSVSWKDLITLIKKKKDTVEIKIITDKPQEDLPAEILKVYQKPGLFHPKFITVDGKIVLIGSGNFTDDGLHLHHNHFLLMDDKKITEFFNRKFLSWWNDTPSEEVYENGSYQIYFSPETDCESVIIQNISTAVKSIHFLNYHFTSEEIAKAIIKKKLSAVDVYGIQEVSTIEPYSVFYPLSDYGCKLKKSNRAGFLHDKLFIIDGNTVITGSYNPTASARRNTECLIIIKDKEIAQKLLIEWKKLWLFYALP